MAKMMSDHDRKMISHYDNMIKEAAKQRNISWMISLYEQLDRIEENPDVFSPMERQFASFLGIGDEDVTERCRKDAPDVSDWYVFNACLEGRPTTMCRILYMLNYKGVQNDSHFHDISKGEAAGQRVKLIGYLLAQGHQCTSNTLRCVALHPTTESIDILRLILPRIDDSTLQYSGALQIAAEQGNVDMICYLVENNANINGMSSQTDWNDMRQNRYAAALHFAVANVHASAVKVLLEHQADIGLKDGNGCTALMLAKQEGSSEAHISGRTPDPYIIAMLEAREKALATK